MHPHFVNQDKQREATARASHDDSLAFAEALVEHAQTEEAVMYPAAILVGHEVLQRSVMRAVTLV
ncbi:hypothetical protein [Methylibium sp.]|jgi:hypothetical protein|uniref:hypothetical protein n=1 Tax=Methylibium sp. TaxID=2067992 RepID=UPI003D121B9F